MHHAGSPRIVISGIGAVSPFGVGRECFWDHVSRGCSGTRAIAAFDASEFGCRLAAPVTDVTIDDVPVLDHDDVWEAGYRADLDVIPNRGRAADVEAGLCNCLGFGSRNSAVVIGRV
jgi:3-oxoacyl-(acyl-carrier-protein) synthase